MAGLMQRVEQEIREDHELAQLVNQEELIVAVTELILEKLKDKNMTRSDLADILGKSKSHVTQLLHGSRNMTLRTVSDIFFNLGYKVVFDAAVERAEGLELEREEWYIHIDSSQTVGWTPRMRPMERLPEEEPSEQRMVA